MLTFTIHEPPSPPSDRLDRAEALVFIKDGFSWAAALFAPLWLLLHRLWWPLLGYIVAIGVLEIIRQGLGADPGWTTLGSIALHLLVGFEADTLRRWRLQRNGWGTVGTVSGRTEAECERRFFAEWLPAQPVVPLPLPTTSSGAPPPLRRTPVVGSLLGVSS